MFLKRQAIVLDEELDPDLVGDIHRYVEGLLKSGLRQRLVTLIKVEINRL
jgi:nuclear pore complex protein Nup205